MTGGTPSRTRPEYFENGSIKWLVSGDINQNEIFDCEGRITEEAMKSSNTKILPLNSVMIALNGQGRTRGSVALLRTEAACNQSLVSISPLNSSELLPEFLFHNLRMRYQELRRMTGDDGNDRRGLNMSLIRDILIPLPSLERQHVIVKKLNYAVSEINLLEEIHAKRNRDFLANLFDTFRDSLLTSACSNSPSIEFGEVGNFVRGPFGGSLKKSMFKQSGIAVYEQQHAINDTFDSFRYFVDDDKYQEMKRFEVHINDLIMSCSGTYGKIAVLPEGSPRGIINQALLKITPYKGVRSQFIKHWMQSSLFQEELKKDIGGAALQNVPSVAKMKSIKIRLPDERTQMETIEKLEQIWAEVEVAKLTQLRIKNNYIALRQSILSHEFTYQEAVA
jgi:type I restriction enzyme S subunit